MANRSRKLLTAGAAAVVAVGLFAGAALAYMSDTDEGINIFTIGHVEIEATEPAFPTTDTDGDGVPDDCELLTPYDTVPKDPRIQNTGITDAVVFFRVTSPVEMLTLIDDNGDRGNTDYADLFWFKQAEHGEDSHQNHFDENWVRLTSLAEDGTISTGHEGVNDEGRGMMYIFGYHERLEPGEFTSRLFDEIQNKKYGSGTIGGDEVEQIQIEAFAIQADDIINAGIHMDTTGVLSEADLAHIYNVFFNQNADNL